MAIARSGVLPRLSGVLFAVGFATFLPQFFKPAAVRVGRILGVVGLCLATSALVALAVYGLLEYVGRN